VFKLLLTLLNRCFLSFFCCRFQKLDADLIPSESNHSATAIGKSCGGQKQKELLEIEPQEMILSSDHPTLTCSMSRRQRSGSGEAL
jgi:hypothetical protein